MGRREIVLIAAAAAILGVIWFSGAGRRALSRPESAQIFPGKEEKKECAPAPSQRKFSYEPYYDGPLADAHVHMPVSSRIVAMVAKRLGNVEFNLSLFDRSFTTDQFACLFQGSGIRQALGLFLTTKFSLGAEVRTMKKFKKDYPGLMVASFMPVPVASLRVSAADIRKTLNANPGLIRAIGELKAFDNTAIDNPHFSEMYRLADEYDLIIMIHPHHEDKAVMKKILSQYPKVQFLLHGGGYRRGPHGKTNERVEVVADLMKDHPNMYYSLGGPPGLSGFRREHRFKMPEKTETMTHLYGTFDRELEKAVSDWKVLIEQYPDRFMWETDRQRPQWAFDEDIAGILEEFARSFIGRLDPAVREKFAYQNTERLFSK